MTEPLSDEQLGKMRREHVPVTSFGYTYCKKSVANGRLSDTWVDWPCSTAILLAELDRREVQDRWPGRNHVSPWAWR